MTELSGESLKGAVPLSEAIAALRDELMRACWAGQGQTLRFRPAPVELTLQAAVTVSGKARAGVKWWLIEAGGDLSRDSVATQTVKVTLEPVMFDGQGRAVDVFIDTDDSGHPDENDASLDAPG